MFVDSLLTIPWLYQVNYVRRLVVFGEEYHHGRPQLGHQALDHRSGQPVTRPLRHRRGDPGRSARLGEQPRVPAGPGPGGSDRRPGWWQLGLTSGSGRGSRHVSPRGVHDGGDSR